VSSRRRAENVLTAEVVLTLQAAQTLPREELEEATLHVADVLAEYITEISDGASASANFETCSIEIDMLLTGPSQADVHGQLTRVIAALDEHCALKLRPAEQRNAPANSLALTASATQFVAPLKPGGDPAKRLVPA
jgi:hypothetical protein